jgi:hypothetical protein
MGDSVPPPWSPDGGFVFREGAGHGPFCWLDLFGPNSLIERLCELLEIFSLQEFQLGKLDDGATHSIRIACHLAEDHITAD